MALGCIYGDRVGEHLQLLPVAHTTWEAWSTLYPHTRLLSEQTGHSRNYSFDPYIDYSVNGAVYFPQTPQIDSRLHPKEMVLGLARAGRSRAYPYSDLEQTGVVNDRFGGEEILIVYAGKARLALGYLRKMEERIFHFEPAGKSTADFPLFTDVETGSTWNILGAAIDGPMAGRQLSPIAAYSAYWFGWASFWQETQIWDGESLLPSTVERQSWGTIKIQQR